MSESDSIHMIKDIATKSDMIMDRLEKLERRFDEVSAKYNETIKFLADTQRSVIDSIKINSITVRASNGDSGRIAPKSTILPVGEVKLDGTIKQSNVKIITNDPEPEPEPHHFSDGKSDDHLSDDSDSAQDSKNSDEPEDPFKTELTAVVRDEVKIFASGNKELSIRDVLVGPLRKPHLANVDWEVILKEVDLMANLAPNTQGSTIYTKIVQKINARIGK